MSADEVHRLASTGPTRIGRATVYRTLAQLADVGILVRTVLDPENGVASYKLHGKKHDALVCLRCERVEEVVDEVFDSRTKAVAEANGFMLSRYQLTLYGHCASCRSRLPGE
jgi:Fur family ferric uptake transcriptional regulator